MPKFRVTYLNALGLEQTKEVTAQLVGADANYMRFTTGIDRMNFLIPRDKLVSVEELTG